VKPRTPATRRTDGNRVQRPHCVRQRRLFDKEAGSSRGGPFALTTTISGTRLNGDAATCASPLARDQRHRRLMSNGGYLGNAIRYANDLALIRLDDAQVAADRRRAVAPLMAHSRSARPRQLPDCPTWPAGLKALWRPSFSNDLLTNSSPSTATARRSSTSPAPVGAGSLRRDSGGPLYVPRRTGNPATVCRPGIVKWYRAIPAASRRVLRRRIYKGRYSQPARASMPLDGRVMSALRRQSGLVCK